MKTSSTLTYEPLPGQPPHWTELSLCTEVDSDLFSPVTGGSTRQAKQVCRACEVRAECLEYALAHDQRFGVWGGLSERERRRLKREAAEGKKVA